MKCGSISSFSQDSPNLGTIAFIMTKRLVVGISGSSGAILGIRLLQALQGGDIETHLVITPSARLTIEQETSYTVSQVQALAHRHYSPRDIGATIASGSFDTLGMVVIPCSIKSLSAIANSYSEDLLTRAADVTLKEGRPLLLVVRETPLHRGHIRLMDLAARAGAVLFPPVPAFYARPQSVDELVDALVGRVLRRMGIENPMYRPWQGLDKDAPSLSFSPSPTGWGKGAGDEGPSGSESGGPSVDSDLWDVSAMTLATAASDGEPHAAAVYFAADPQRRNLYFFSSTTSQHSQDVAARPRASGAIYPSPTPLGKGLEDESNIIRGLQLRGEVALVPPGETWQQAWQLYLQKFPFVKNMEAIVARNQLYVFRPAWVRWMDNRQGFGHQEEWTAHE